jgi:hypothetical protein
VDVESWFVSPMKERRSVWLLGVGKSAIVVMMSLLMEYPSEVGTRQQSGLGSGKTPGSGISLSAMQDCVPHADVHLCRKPPLSSDDPTFKRGLPNSWGPQN